MIEACCCRREHCDAMAGVLFTDRFDSDVKGMAEGTWDPILSAERFEPSCVASDGINAHLVLLKRGEELFEFDSLVIASEDQMDRMIAVGTQCRKGRIDIGRFGVVDP